MSRKWKYVLAAFAFATLTAGAPVASQAKGKKRVVTATVNGKHVKWSGRLLSFNYGESGLIIIGTTPGAKKTVGIGCPVLLDMQTYPVTFDSNCSGQYAENRQKRYWFNTGVTSIQGPFQVTFDSFDGTVIQGSFSGTLPALIGATSPVTIDGTFSGPLNGR